MTRLLTYLTPIPNLFTFIAIVLINVGGVNPTLGSKYQLTTEKNSAFSMVKWDYTLSPTQQPNISHSYHLFLNRLCVGYNSITSGSSETIHRCRNDRFSLTLSTWMCRLLSMSCRLSWSCLLMAMALVAERGEKLRRVRGLAALCTGTAFLFMVIALVIIVQMVHLRNQIRNNTRPSVGSSSSYPPLGSPAGGRQVWTVDISDVTLGTTVLGLTWAAVVALMIEFVMWMLVLVFTGTRKDTPVVETKNDGY
ncbi:hypothetical protein BKA65DRAFT_557703 [Rhexocercosporidium sp. MPI-PUGE-AT-0058]|nr:hypothetical protein BKA65DRAFT_557703 [Rhexocercosporidium sp. MPI-PUGE-AT-0058]